MPGASGALRLAERSSDVKHCSLSGSAYCSPDRSGLAVRTPRASGSPRRCGDRAALAPHRAVLGGPSHRCSFPEVSRGMVSTSPDDLGVAHMWNFTSALWIAEGVEDDVWGGDKAAAPDACPSRHCNVEVWSRRLLPACYRAERNSADLSRVGVSFFDVPPGGIARPLTVCPRRTHSISPAR